MTEKEMKMKRWLERGRKYDRLLKIKTHHYESLSAPRGPAELIGIQLDNYINKTEAKEIDKAQLRNEIEELAKTLSAIDKETDKILMLLQNMNMNEYEILYLKYIQRESWEKIKKITKYSPSRIYEFHRLGLQRISLLVDVPEVKEE